MQHIEMITSTNEKRPLTPLIGVRIPVPQPTKTSSCEKARKIKLAQIGMLENMKKGAQQWTPFLLLGIGWSAAKKNLATGF